MSDRNIDEATLATLDRRLMALGLERFWTQAFLFGTIALYCDHEGAFAMAYHGGGPAGRPIIYHAVGPSDATLDDQVDALRPHLDRTRAAARARRPTR
jgi:hypothetical protein